MEKSKNNNGEMMTDQPINPTGRACPHCRQSIAEDARKCHHCGESLVERSSIAQWTRKLMAVVGVITGLLSLFFGLKEGYFFIQERQEKRAMAASYLEAAERFLQLDSLTYAEESLKKALAAKPNDQRLRARTYFMRADHFLREADYFGSQFPEDRLADVPNMVLEGFSLLDAALSKDEKIRLLTSLGRLLQYDRRWQSENGISEVFDQARQLAPNDQHAAFWYGEWLMGSDIESEKQRGRELIQQAATLDSGNPVYTAALGRILVEQHEFKLAFDQFIYAIESKPDQRQLQRIRAANGAKRHLAFGLIDAHGIQSILGDEFFGMSMDERVNITRQAVHHSNNRRLAWVAAQLFHHIGENAWAEEQLRVVLGRYDEHSSPEQLVLLSEVLTAQGKHDEQKMVDDLLSTVAEREQFEEVLESGIEGQHRFKVGLKLDKSDNGSGVLVAKAYDYYPFHKAGVRDGDRIIEFGHRKMNKMLDILHVIHGFSPGMDVPLKLIREEQTVDLLVVME